MSTHAHPAGPRWQRLLPLAWALFALLVVAPVFRRPFAFASSYDWRYFQTWLEIGRRTLVWYHQLPLWNPWTCGGQVYLANPQSLVATPTFPLVLIFGSALGVKLILAVYYFCAFDGSYRLARDYGRSPAAALLAALAFGTGGWLALHFAVGHGNFLGAALLPYAVYFYRRSRDRLAWAIPLGAIAAWIVGGGGTSTSPICLVLLLTLATLDALILRSPRPLLGLALGGLVALGLGAVRVLPALEFAIDHPRHTLETDLNPPWVMLSDAYRWHGLGAVGRRYGFHEYGWKLPYLTLPLWLWALGVKGTRTLWIVLLVAVALVAGRFIPFGPTWLLQHLPILRDLRVPSRYTLIAALVVPLLCAFAFDDLRRRLRWSRPVTALLLLLVAVEGLQYDWLLYRDLFTLERPLAGKAAPFYQVQGHWSVMMEEVFANHGDIGCDEEAPLQRAASLDSGPGVQARVEEGAGTVVGVDWSPNRIVVEAVLARPGAVSVNQNWNEHWSGRLTGGSAVEVVRVGPKLARDHDGGRLGVALPEGHRTIELRYRPWSFVIGFWLSLVSLPLAVAAFILLRRRHAGAHVAPGAP